MRIATCRSQSASTRTPTLDSGSCRRYPLPGPPKIARARAQKGGACEVRGRVRSRSGAWATGLLDRSSVCLHRTDLRFGGWDSCIADADISS